MSQGEIKRLLIITPGFPADEQDTTCLPAVQQFVICYRRRFPQTDITIISLHYPYHNKKYKWHGITVHALDGRSRGGITGRYVILQAIVLSLKLSAKNRPDAILALWLSDTALVAKTAAKLLRVPYLTWMHGQDARAGNKYYWQVKPRSTDIAAISAFQSDFFFKAYGVKPAYIIHNGINESLFPPFNEQERDIDIFAAGNLIEVKRYHLLIEIVKDLRDNGFTNIKVAIAGDGILKADIEQQIWQYHLQDNITLLGKISHREVLVHMSRARLFLHTSQYEGHSTVMLEALYAGCWVLSFIPVGSKPAEQFLWCSDTADMTQKARDLLQALLVHRQVLYSSMAESVNEMNSVLLSKVRP